MSLGFGIFLFVVGAILAFAVTVAVPGVDLRLVGYILMGAGVVVVIIGIALIMRRRTSSVTTRSHVDPNTGQRSDTVERRDPSDYNG